MQKKRLSLAAFWSALPALGASLLSCMGCPVCLPLYVGLFSLFGFDGCCLEHATFWIMGASFLLSLTILTRSLYRNHSPLTPLYGALVCAGGALTGNYLHEPWLLYPALLGFFIIIMTQRWRRHHHEHGTMCKH